MGGYDMTDKNLNMAFPFIFHNITFYYKLQEFFRKQLDIFLKE